MIFRAFRIIPLLAACAFLSLSAPLHAGEVKYPETGPGITLTVPDTWKVVKKNGNIIFASPDGKVTVSLSKSAAESGKSAAVAAKDFAKGSGMEDVKIKEVPTTEEDGNKVTVAIALGKREGADYVATAMMLTTAGGAKVAIFAFGLKDAVLDNKEVDAIMNSVK